MKELKYDIVIVGSGASGIAAACSASRAGARVAIIERSAVFGGLATTAHVGTICGLYLDRPEPSELVGEFALNFIERLQKKQGQINPQVFGENLYYLPYRSPYFESVCDDFLQELDVDTFLHSTCYRVEQDSAKVSCLEALIWDRPARFLAHAFIDATGEGVISSLLDAEMIEDNELQAPGYVIGLSNLPKGIDEKTFNLIALKEVVAATRLGIMPKPEVYLSVVPGSLVNGSMQLKLALPFQRTGEFNELSQIERFCRKRAIDCFTYLKSNVDIFENSHLNFLAPSVGVRSGSRALGREILRTKDVLSSRKFDDAVANALWPIEFWDGGRRAKLEYFDGYYQIPRGALISKSLSNLYFCGRGISAEPKALSSARVIGTSFSTGTAAGKLASL